MNKGMFSCNQLYKRNNEVVNFNYQNISVGIVELEMIRIVINPLLYFHVEPFVR